MPSEWDIEPEETRPKKATKPTKGMVKDLIEAACLPFDLPFEIVQKEIAPYRLTRDEIEALADALYDVIAVNNKIWDWIQKGGSLNTYGKLIVCLALIGDSKYRVYVRIQEEKARQNGHVQADDQSGGTRSDNRTNGFGENAADEIVLATAPLGASDRLQTRTRPKTK